MLRFMGWQRVVHDWVTELNWTRIQNISGHVKHSNGGDGAFNGGRLFFIQELSFDEGVRLFWSLQKWAVNNSLILRAIKSCWRVKVIFSSPLSSLVLLANYCVYSSCVPEGLSSQACIEWIQLRYFYGQKLSTFWDVLVSLCLSCLRPDKTDINIRIVSTIWFKMDSHSCHFLWEQRKSLSPNHPFYR